MRYQGPITNLFQPEMGAKRPYPGIFGERPEYTGDEPYPRIPEDERLSDRNGSRVVTGEDRTLSSLPKGRFRIAARGSSSCRPVLVVFCSSSFYPEPCP